MPLYCVRLEEDKCLDLSHADLQDVFQSCPVLGQPEVDRREILCAVARVKRSVQTTNGIARMSPESRLMQSSWACTSYNAT